LARLAKTNWDMVVNKLQHRWAYVIVSAPVLEGFRPGAQTDRQTLDMLQDFIRQSVPLFQLSEMPYDQRPAS
jgi:hypothetical protein